MKIKQIFGILTLLAVILSFSGCKNKADNSDASSESVTTIDGEGKSESTDRNASPENKEDIVYPFDDISLEHIGEVLFGHHHDRSASKTYTDNNAVTKIVEYLNKAPMSQDGYGDKDRIYSMTYFLELKDTNGDIKYKIYFSSKYEEGYLCDFHTITSINKDGTTTGDSRFFYLDNEYLFPFIECIETVDGREPSWVYSTPFDGAIDENALSSVVLGYGDTVKEFTDDR